MQLEKQIANLPEQEKQTYRTRLAEDETLALKESRKKTTTADFESLAIIGRGAFGTYAHAVNYLQESHHLKNSLIILWQLFHFIILQVK